MGWVTWGRRTCSELYCSSRPSRASSSFSTCRPPRHAIAQSGHRAIKPSRNRIIKQSNDRGHLLGEALLLARQAIKPSIPESIK
eukprot:3240709-Prymnesium_polylepis.1